MDVVVAAADTLKVVTHKQYHTAEHLSPATAPRSPFELFRAWLTGVQGVVPEAEAMSLSTASAAGSDCGAGAGCGPPLTAAPRRGRPARPRGA